MGQDFGGRLHGLMGSPGGLLRGLPTPEFVHKLSAANMEHSSISNTPQPPYYAVIFTSLRTDGDRGYGHMAEKMASLAAQQPGLPHYGLLAPPFDPRGLEARHGIAWAGASPTSESPGQRRPKIFHAL